MKVPSSPQENLETVQTSIPAPQSQPISEENDPPPLDWSKGNFMPLGNRKGPMTQFWPMIGEAESFGKLLEKSLLSAKSHRRRRGSSSSSGHCPVHVWHPGLLRTACYQPGDETGTEGCWSLSRETTEPGPLVEWWVLIVTRLGLRLPVRCASRGPSCMPMPGGLSLRVWSVLTDQGHCAVPRYLWVHWDLPHSALTSFVSLPWHSARSRASYPKRRDWSRKQLGTANSTILGKMEATTILLLILGLLCFLVIYLLLDNLWGGGSALSYSGKCRVSTTVTAGGREDQAANFMSCECLSWLPLIESGRNLWLERQHPGCQLADKVWPLLTGKTWVSQISFFFCLRNLN